jgi:hypothetical protein
MLNYIKVFDPMPKIKFVTPMLYKLEKSVAFFCVVTLSSFFSFLIQL